MKNIAILGLSALLLSTPALSQDGSTRRGMSVERLARINGVMDNEIKNKTFAGAVSLIARDGRIVHVATHGFQDAAKTKPMQRDSIFQLASMTKPIVSAVAMQLVEEGLVKLNDPISRWLPELKDLKVEIRKADGTFEDVPLTRQITLQDLLTHSSGFTYAGSAPSARLRELYDRHNIEGRVANISADEMLKRLGTIPLAFQPGTTFHYSISTDVVGLLLERITKTSLDKLVEQRLTAPLGMKDSGWYVPADKKHRLAEALDSDPQKAAAWAAYRVFEKKEGQQYHRGGAGMVSTADDYLKFAQMILNRGEYNGKRYLSEKTVKFMLSNHIPGYGGTTFATTGPGYGFGLGFAVRLQDGVGFAPGTTGDAMWAGAWGTSFTIDPKENLIGIFMAQDLSNRVQTRMLFKNLIYGAMVRSRS